MRSLAVAAVVLAAGLAGCLSPKSPGQLAVQPGDFVVADLTREVEDGPATHFQDAHLVVAEQVPGDDELPESWTRNGTQAATPGLISAMDGMAEGETRDTGWLKPPQAYGEVEPGLVDRFDRQAWLPRTVNATVEDGTVTVYGRTWPANRTDDGAYIQVDAADAGATVEHPGFWSDGTRMWRSAVVDFNASHIQVRHRVEAGMNVTRGSVTGRVTEVNASTVVVDRNHPLAGQRVRFEITVEQIVVVEPGPTEAPGFSLATIDGQRFRLQDHRGDPVLLYFFATWCSVCKTQTPRIVDVAESHPNATVLAISVDPNEPPGAVGDYREQYDGGAVRWAVDRAGTVGSTYQVISIPKTVVVGPDGSIVFQAGGEVATTTLGRQIEGP